MIPPSYSYSTLFKNPIYLFPKEITLKMSDLELEISKICLLPSNNKSFFIRTMNRNCHSVLHQTSFQSEEFYLEYAPYSEKASECYIGVPPS